VVFPEPSRPSKVRKNPVCESRCMGGVYHPG
jgi:hypothetical protein